MAFINSDGRSISFDASDLIEDLKSDIEEFGGDTIVWVVTQEREGVTLYKDYDFEPILLEEGESLKQITMTALMLLYEEENSLF